MDKRKKFVERAGTAQLCEREDGIPRRIRAVGITADVVNGNGRRYANKLINIRVINFLIDRKK